MGVRKEKYFRLQKPVARLLDANLNRAREGIRVIEDAARFLWDNAGLYRSLRRLRHELHEITAEHFHTLVKSRDSIRDSGRRIHEAPRKSVKEVLAANIRRAQEAVRVLEEYGKIFSKDAGSRFKSIRYRLYTLEKKLIDRL